MKTPGLLIKIIVVSSSLILVGGCISAQSETFRLWNRSPEKATKSNTVTNAPQFLPGTKSPLPNGFFSGLTPAGTYDGAEDKTNPAQE